MKKFIFSLFLLTLTGCTIGAPQNNLSDINNTNNISQQPPSPIPSPVPTVENKVVGTFSTKLLDKDKGRINNIKLAIKSINGVTIEPGAVFSFNEVVGPRTQARGFKKALIILRKEKTLGYGGGICQVSSTIYNAARGAGLEIVERHQHDREVGYVELGNDATVNYGSLDLKIRNTLNVPIEFKVTLDNEKVSAEVITQG